MPFLGVGCGFVNRALIEEASSIVYPIMVRVSWIACPYFEGLVLLFFSILILLVMVIFLDMTLGDSVLRRMVPLLRSGVDNRYVSRDVTNIYYFDFFIGIIFDNISLLSIP